MASAEEKPGSMLRGMTWESSFDKAGDAAHNAAEELKNAQNADCSPAGLNIVSEPPAVIEQKVAECEHNKQKAQAYAKEAAGIRDTQYVFADVSRVSDVAAVGAIGGVAYAELFKKKKDQANTYRSAAKIQETAGYVSYATGATDFTMGAYAYMAQKSKLEQMQKALSKTSEVSASDQAAISKLSAAAEQTKNAAYSHMLYGAGKAAVGYASMELAKRSRRQAENMESIDTTAYAEQMATVVTPPSDVAGGTPFYRNNSPQITLPSGTAADSSTDTGSGGGGTAYTGGGGASVMPSPEFRSPASVGAGSGGGLGGGSAGAKSPPAASSPVTAAEEKKEETKGAPANEALGGFEVNLTGGGGPRYGGGGGSSGDETGVAGLLGGLMGNNNGPASNATGLNPNNVYKDAMAGLDGTEQGSMAGVNSSNQTLFAVIKVKYNKMMEGGRLQGPGAVEVKN